MFGEKKRKPVQSSSGRMRIHTTDLVMTALVFLVFKRNNRFSKQHSLHFAPASRIGFVHCPRNLTAVPGRPIVGSATCLLDVLLFAVYEFNGDGKNKRRLELLVEALRQVKGKRKN